jgi:hypothetical protein
MKRYSVFLEQERVLLVLEVFLDGTHEGDLAISIDWGHFASQNQAPINLVALRKLAPGADD